MSEGGQPSSMEVLDGVGGGKGKWGKRLAIALAIGAAGSGLWDIAVKPSLGWVGRAVLQALSYAFSGYLNYLYGSLGKGTSEAYSILPYLLLVLVMIAAPWVSLVYFLRRFDGQLENILSLRKKLRGDEEAPTREGVEKDLDILEASVTRQRRHAKWSFVVLLAVSVLVDGEAAFRTAYKWEACIFVERSIEMLAPRILPQEVLELRAQYRGVDNAEKFLALVERLRSTDSRVGVGLPAFTPVN
jgi:hypothetical protein